MILAILLVEQVLGEMIGLSHDDFGRNQTTVIQHFNDLFRSYTHRSLVPIAEEAGWLKQVFQEYAKGREIKGVLLTGPKTEMSDYYKQEALKDKFLMAKLRGDLIDARDKFLPSWRPRVRLRELIIKLMLGYHYIQALNAETKGDRRLELVRVALGLTTKEFEALTDKGETNISNRLGPKPPYALILQCPRNSKYTIYFELRSEGKSAIIDNGTIPVYEVNNPERITQAIHNRITANESLKDFLRTFDEEAVSPDYDEEWLAVVEEVLNSCIEGDYFHPQDLVTKLSDGISL